MSTPAKNRLSARPPTCAELAVPSLVLGSLLRERREKLGLSLKAAATSVRVPEVAIADAETGHNRLEARELMALCDTYGIVDHAERVALLDLARKPEGPEWWSEYRDLIPNWFEGYLELEQAASVIRTYEVQLIPGLLQTEEYARAIIRLGIGGKVPPDEVERHVRLRLRRQQILTGLDAPHLWVILDEGALLRTVGDLRIMFDQIEHLIDACELPHVTIQVLPLDASEHPLPHRPIVMLRLPHPSLDDIVYVEHLTSAFYLNRPADIHNYRHTLNRLTIAAGPAKDTPKILRRILPRLSSGGPI